MTTSIRGHAAVILAVLLAGCASVAAPIAPVEETPAQATQRRTEAPRPAYNLSGYPPAVREGYIDGCETAKGSTYGRKDERRMSADGQYAMGWNDGFSICSRR